MSHPIPRVLSLSAFCCFLTMLPSLSHADPPAPDFGPNVLIFDPSASNLQQQLDTIFHKQERSEFGPGRYAILFKPGSYKLDAQIGFYTQLCGLGKSPDDVSITGSVRSTAAWRRGNATVNFWRAIENLSVTPTSKDNVNVWAVSQGTALRRFHVKGNLNLWDGGWSSGGFMADCKIDGTVNPGSQQQWLSRNNDWGRWVGGVWNMVFVGCSNPPAGNWPDPPYTKIEKTPVIAEKPYPFIDDTGHYFVMVPALRTDASGITWAAGQGDGTPIPIEQFYIAHPTDTAVSINAALVSGKNLLLTPGIYHLESSINVARPDTIVLGLGYPTLRPTAGTPAITVADIDGVKIAGLLLEAGQTNSRTLLQIGDAHTSISHQSDPTILYDIFARVGGATPGTTDAMVTINSNDVIGDNFWLWRADHGRGAGWTENKNANGLLVSGDNVTLYGLAVEHTQKYQTLWLGNGGRVYFYQSEMPYDPPTAAAWSHDGVTGYASYKVADTVTTHQAWGLGVYCVFTRAPIVATTAIETPIVPGVQMHHMVTLRLDGQNGSGIAHVINDKGAAVGTTQKSRVD